MLTLPRSICWLLFPLVSLSVSLSASPPPATDDIWTPQNVPTAGTIPFVFYYQQFLRANPFAIDTQPRTPEDRAENRRRHQRAAELYAAMAKIAKKLAQSDDLLPAGCVTFWHATRCRGSLFLKTRRCKPVFHRFPVITGRNHCLSCCCATSQARQYCLTHADRNLTICWKRCLNRQFDELLPT